MEVFTWFPKSTMAICQQSRYTQLAATNSSSLPGITPMNYLPLPTNTATLIWGRGGRGGGGLS